jgi:hypothetical protein
LFFEKIRTKIVKSRIILRDFLSVSKTPLPLRGISPGGEKKLEIKQIFSPLGGN